jgi:cbb3-type cytochrome c oxidase subunit I
VQDALVQWWYGHNAVAFFLTTPVLGIMYYFLPKAADRPVYSYRLSIIHFWALVFIYIWAGPHHLLYTALPDWAQTLGMLFSLMLWAPSWGGMLNGLLTLKGAWQKVRTDPVLKFFAAGVTFYGPAPDPGDAAKVMAPMQFHLAGLDKRVAETAWPWIGALGSQGKTVEAFTYAGANHAFHNDTSAERYNEAAAKLAWQRTLDFFGRTLVPTLDRSKP